MVLKSRNEYDNRIIVMNLSHIFEVLKKGVTREMQNQKLLVYQWMLQLAQLAQTYYFMLGSGIARIFDTWNN